MVIIILKSSERKKTSCKIGNHMTDKADIIVWEKNTKTNEVKKVTLKLVVGALNNFTYDNEVGIEYFINRKDIK